MSVNKAKQKKVPPLPKCIRDELRMSYALKAYSHIECGGGKNQKTPITLIRPFLSFTPLRSAHDCWFGIIRLQRTFTKS